MMTILLTVVVLAGAMTAMAIGVLMGRPRLPHGCSGGKHPAGPDGESLRCDTCTCDDPGQSGNECELKNEQRDAVST